MKKILTLILCSILIMACCYGCLKKDLKPSDDNGGDTDIVIKDDIAGESKISVDNRHLDKIISAKTFDIDENIVNADKAVLSANGLFTSGMVLQSKMVNCIFGKTTAKNIAIKFKNVFYYGIVTSGKWEVYLPPFEAETVNYSLIIFTEQGKQILENVCIGEVFLCEGQSNMDTTMGSYIDNADVASAISSANDKFIRLFTVDKVYGTTSVKTPVDEYVGENKWLETNSQNVSAFSASGYLYGRKMREYLKVPIGLVSAAVGGTGIAYWLPKETYKDLISKGVNVYTNADWGLAEPANGYNGMIHQLRKLKFRGVLWYQGETDALGNASGYDKTMPALIKAYREIFDSPNMFWTLMELPRFNSPLGYSNIRTAMQITAESDPLTCMSVSIDLGEWENIHPLDKKEIAERAAAETMFSFYGMQTDRCPKIVKVKKINDTKIKFTFKNVGEGLKILNNNSGFEIRTKNANGVTVDKKNGYTLTLDDNAKSIILEIAGSAKITRIRYAVNPLLNYDSTLDCSKQVSIFNSFGMPLDQFIIDFEAKNE